MKNNKKGMEDLEIVAGGKFLKTYRTVSPNDVICDDYRSRYYEESKNPRCRDCRYCQPGNSGYYCQKHWQ